MKLKFKFFFVSLFFAAATFAQCAGNCENGFGGQSVNGNVLIGFYKNAQLNGLGDFNGKSLYSGQWKEGKKHGFLVYNETGNFSFGMFDNDLKTGTHFTVYKDGSFTAVKFNKGVEAGKDAIVKSSEAECPMGNCKNGVGKMIHKAPNGDPIEFIGTFINGKLNGPGYSYHAKSGNVIYGTFKDDVIDGISLIVYPNGATTISEMKNDTKHGYAINIFADGKFIAQIYENGKFVKNI